MQNFDEVIQKAAKCGTCKIDKQKIYSEKYMQLARAGKICANYGILC